MKAVAPILGCVEVRVSVRNHRRLASALIVLRSCACMRLSDRRCDRLRVG